MQDFVYFIGMTVNSQTGNLLRQRKERLVELEDAVHHSDAMGQRECCYSFEQNICRPFEEDAPGGEEDWQ